MPARGGGLSAEYRGSVRPQLLLLSSSRVFGGAHLAYALGALRDFFAGCRNVYFVPFAATHTGWDSCTANINQALAPLGLDVVGIHTLDPQTAIQSAEAVFVGGGNSFRLLKQLQLLQLIEPVRRRVTQGELRYAGASAGSNMACPSLRTTNDMPIVQPPSFDALNLVPFQINPHYLEADPGAPYAGETRSARIEEFLQENDVRVIGLREGAWLRRDGARLELGGVAGARLFQRGAEPEELPPGTDLSWLLDAQPGFDVGS